MSKMLKMRNMVRRFATGESGATMVEYAIMVSLIAVVAVAAVRVVGTKTSAAFIAVGDALPSASAPPSRQTLTGGAAQISTPVSP